MNIRHIFSLIAFIGIAGLTSLAAPPPALAGPDPVYTHFLSDKALSGYDAVSFHTGKPVKGKAKYFYNYKGATFLFVDQANRNQFIANPGKYAPAYGGYCAWAVAQGKLAPGDPKYWTLKDGVLYINFNGRIQKRWEKDPDGFVEQAEQNWPGLIDR